jgi:hypothetical protein
MAGWGYDETQRIVRIMTDAESDKKRIERLYLEAARATCSIFPKGRIICHEKPDFLLRTEDGELGIEVTELCSEEERARGSKLSKVPGKAQSLYYEMRDADAVHVSAAFSVRANGMNLPDLATSLADFVYRNRYNMGSSFEGKLPDGYCHIGILKPLKGMPPTRPWHVAAGYGFSAADKELLGHRIEEKNRRLPVYRDAARRVWLLVVSDEFLGRGYVPVLADNLASWRFPFGFEKVLLFCRELRGSRVVEMQRDEATLANA